MTLREARRDGERMSGALRGAVLVAVACAAGCGDGPTDVVEDLGECAERRDLVRFRKLFTEESKDLLKARWREDGLTEPKGWLDLMIGYLGRDKEPPEILGEQLQGEEEAIVKVAKDLDKDHKRIVQDLRLIKEDGHWRVALGAMVYSEQDLDTGVEKKPKAPPKATDDDWGLKEVRDQKKAREDLEDFDLEKL